MAFATLSWMSVYPSAGARTTCSVARLLEAPTRFSTTNCCPSRSESHCAIRRVARSPPPPGAPPCGHFDFDLHARIGQAGLDHGRGGPYVAEILLEHRPTRHEILAPRQYVAHAHDVGHRRTSLRKRGRDVAHGLLALSDDVVGNCHRSVVEA